MRIVRKEKKKNKKKQRVEQNKGGYRPWKVRSKKYSEYPYVVTVSFFRKTIFLSASDLRGRIKLWTNAGRLGFKGGDRTQFLAIVEVAQKFFKKLPRYGIRDVFLKFNNFRRSRHAIRKAIRKLKLTGKRGPKKQPNRWKWVKRNGKRIKIKKQVRRRKKLQQSFKLKSTNIKPKRGSRKVRFLGIWTELNISFNGCRDKKKRRKRKRRRARKIRLR